MTVATETFWNVSTGNGVTKVFGFTFPISSTDDVVVLLDGAEAAGNFTVALTDIDNPEGGGSVTFADTFQPANGVEVLRIRRLEYLQETSLPNQGAFNAKTVERAIDRVVMLTQQVAKRALLIPDVALSDGWDSAVPDFAAAAAGDVLRLKSDKSGFEWATGPTTGPQGEQGEQGEPGSSSGDVLGPATNADNGLAVWNGVNSKTLKQITAAAMRGLLDLEAGTDFVAYGSFSANALTLIGQTFAQMRASLDLEAGTDFYSKSAADAAFQPIDAQLTAFAANSGVTGTITVSTSTPSGGSDGDLWLEREA